VAPPTNQVNAYPVRGVTPLTTKRKRGYLTIKLRAQNGTRPIVNA